MSLFLIIAWIVSFKATCLLCCDEGDCNGFTSQSTCQNTYPGSCKWTGSECRRVQCSDYDTSCSSHGNCIYSAATSACAEITSCANYSTSADCNGEWVGDNRCTWSGTACKAVTCGDFTSDGQTTCENYHGEIDGLCRFTAGVCALTTSCASWSDRPTDCPSKFFDGASCFHDGTDCKPAHTCEDFASSGQSICEQYHTGIAGSCKFTTGSPATCTLTTSCASWTDRAADCPSKYFDRACIHDGTNCKDRTCSNTAPVNCYPSDGCTYSGGACNTASSCNAWSSQSSSNCSQGEFGDYSDCKWNATDSTCNPKPSCGAQTTLSDCENIGCAYLDVCPVDPSSRANLLRVSSLLVVLLLTLLV